MLRLSIVFTALLFLFSCSRHLVVREINTQNITVSPQTVPVDSILESMVKPYRDSLEKDMNTLVAVSAAPLGNQAGWGTLAAGILEFVFDRRGKGKTFTAMVNNL